MILFRNAIKRLNNVRNDIAISFDHNNQIILGEKNQEKLRIAHSFLERTIRKLESIK